MPRRKGRLPPGSLSIGGGHGPRGSKGWPQAGEIGGGMTRRGASRLPHGCPRRQGRASRHGGLEEKKRLLDSLPLNRRCRAGPSGTKPTPHNWADSQGNYAKRKAGSSKQGGRPPRRPRESGEGGIPPSPSRRGAHGEGEGAGTAPGISGLRRRGCCSWDTSSSR